MLLSFFLLEANSIAVSTERGWFWQLCDPDTSLSLNVFSALLSWLISGWESEALCEHPAAVELGSWSPGCLLRAKRSGPSCIANALGSCSREGGEGRRQHYLVKQILEMRKK